jgi:hypothetical protein
MRPCPLAARVPEGTNTKQKQKLVSTMSDRMAVRKHSKELL